MDSRVRPTASLSRVERTIALSAPTRWIVAGSAWFAFVVAWFPLYPMVGPALSILTIIPMVITAWFWGRTVALAVGVAALPFIMLLFSQAGGFESGEATLSGAVFGAVALIAVGWLTGQLRRFILRLADEATERETALSELSAAQQRLRTLSDGLPVGLYQTTADGRILEGNSRLVEILGFPDRETMLQTNVNSLYPADGDRVRFVERMTERGGMWQEMELIRYDGAPIWVRDRAHMVVDERGGVLYFDGVLEDITDRRSTEEALRVSTERFRVAFREAPIGMGLARITGVVLQANAALGRMLGRDPEDLVGTQWQDVVFPDDLTLVAAAFQSLAEEPQTSIQTELRIIGAGGDPTWVLLTVAPVKDAHGNVEYLIAHLLDISDRRRAQEALENLVKTKDEFVASVSHELRTPLTVVHGLAQELRDSLHQFPLPELEELIGLIAAESAEVASLVEDLLVSARADIGRLTVLPKEINLSDELDKVIRSVPRDGRARVKYAVGDVWMRADPVRVRQIIRNLLTNAFRYGGTNVEVAARTNHGSVYLTVSDDGEGVPLEHRDAIFEPYEALHGNPGTPHSVGLGLTVSRKLARLMGGDLRYRFENERSVFELTLPACGDPVGPARTEIEA